MPNSCSAFWTEIRFGSRQLVAKRQEHQRCYDYSSGAFIEFRPNPRARFGFSLAQLHQYTLEPDPELPLDSPAARERLVLAFSTGDVVVFGVRLASLLDHLRDQKLAAVWPLAERYANLEPSQPSSPGSPCGCSTTR
jgi:hypothetical protein